MFNDFMLKPGDLGPLPRSGTDIFTALPNAQSQQNSSLDLVTKIVNPIFSTLDALPRSGTGPFAAPRPISADSNFVLDAVCPATDGRSAIIVALGLTALAVGNRSLLSNLFQAASTKVAQFYRSFRSEQPREFVLKVDTAQALEYTAKAFMRQGLSVKKLLNDHNELTRIEVTFSPTVTLKLSTINSNVGGA